MEERDGMRRDGCLEGTPNWRIARFGWVCLWKDRTFVLGGRGIGAGRDSAGCVCEFVGRYKPVRVSQAELVRPLAAPTN